MFTFKVILWQSWIERQSSKREEVGSSPTLDKNSSFCNFHFLSVSYILQSDYEHNQAWHTPSQYPVWAREWYVFVGSLWL